MNQLNQAVLPAARKMKDVEAVLESSHHYMVLLGGHIGQLKAIVDLIKGHNKQVFLHADLIDGLKNDEHAADFYVNRFVQQVLSQQEQALSCERSREG